MSIELSFPFTAPSNYTYDSDLIDIATGQDGNALEGVS